MTINAINIIPIKTDYCPTMGDYAIKKKMNVSWAKKKKGDIVLFDFNGNGTSDHIGIVKSINKDGSITTIEGNTGAGNNANGGQVQRRIRYKYQVNFFVRPKYTKEITAEKLIATAESQLGVKESPRNSNKVEYNRWFYGSNKSAYWCCTFVCWCFAHIGATKPAKKTIPTVKKPTGKYSGTIPTGLLKIGSRGTKVKQLQNFLTWYGIKLNADGEFGSNTQNAVKVFQKTEGLTADGEYGDKSYRKALLYKASSKTSNTTTKTTKETTNSKKPGTTNTGDTKKVLKAYSGTFPTLNNNQKIINGLAFRLCYPYGTSKKKYTFKNGSPTKAYKDAINKVFPNHNSWSNKKQKVGACCDILTAVELGLVGIKVKKDLKDQLVDMPKMTKQLKSTGYYKASDFKGGQIVQRGRKDKSGHTYTICELINGKRYIANSHYKKLGGTYAVMDSVVKTESPKKWKYYKCYTPLGASRTYYKTGDYGYDVVFIQKFLNWYGYTVSVDGDYGEKTSKAISKFQTAVGLKASGRCGKDTIAKMKVVKK
jgi:peptidoglycan hydrolase-like protein with peptidoglycan-binding domain